MRSSIMIGVGVAAVLLTLVLPPILVAILPEFDISVPSSASPLSKKEVVESRVKLSLLCAWLIIPKLWFLAEHAWLRPNDVTSEHFKRSQDLAKDIWTTFAVVLAAVWGVNKFW